MKRFVLPAALLAAGAYYYWRSPPNSAVRLDSGSGNLGFAMAEENSRMHYVTHGFRSDTLHSINLADGRRASRDLPGARVKVIETSNAGSQVKLIIENKEGSANERYSLLSLNGDDWTTRKESFSERLDAGDLALFDTSMTASTETLKISNQLGDYGLRVRVSPENTPPGIEIRIIVDDKLGRAKHYPTFSRPAAHAFTSSSTVVVAYAINSFVTRLEEIDPKTGKRATLLDLSGLVEGMDVAGEGLVALRTMTSGTRLSFVDLTSSKEILDLEWSQGGSKLLGADRRRQKLYFSMSTRGLDGNYSESGWAVPMNPAALRKAAKFFSSMHEWPDLRWKLAGHAVEIMIAVFLLVAGFYFYGTMRDI